MKKVALVTGSSSGFGYLTCLSLAKRGFHVIASMRNLKKKDTLLKAAEDEGLSPHIEVIHLDVTDPRSVEPMVEQIIGEYKQIDLLVNNAGYASGGFVEDVPLEEWRRQFETNVFGLIAVTKAVLPHMRKQKSGRIINISSISGRIGFPGLGPYVASKHAVEGFSESLRLEMLPHNVQVVLIEPGAFQTEIWAKGLAELNLASDSPYSETMNHIQRQVNQIVRHAADPADVVQTIIIAATAAQPRFRYRVGKGVSTSILFKALLPWRLIEDIILKKIYPKK